MLESPAPILGLLPENPFLTRLAAQVEALFAQRLAAWDTKGQPDQFEARLAAADPQALYQACLQSLRQALTAGSVLGGTTDKALQRFVSAEHGSGHGATIDELL